jgi:hypothetical protein
MFEINKTYKIKDINEIHYTATITEETETHISFIDLNGEKQGLQKAQILKWKEIKNSTEGEY